MGRIKNMIENILKEYTEVIAAFVGGIIGIIGSVAILIASHYLREAGKITIFTSLWELKLLRQDSFGGEEEVTSIEDAERAEYIFELDIYNSSEIPRSLRDISIDFKSDNLYCSTSPLIPLKNISSFFPFEKLQIINLLPKELVHIRLTGSINKDNFHMFSKRTIAYIKASQPNKKKFKANLVNIDISSKSKSQ